MTRIAIIGAGAVGGYVAGFMARDGHDVTVIDGWPAHIDQITAEGLRLEGATPEDCFTAKPQALHIAQVESLSRQAPIDIGIIATKSYDTEWATMMMKPLLGPQGYVVSLQNSINEERIAGIVGWGKVVGCIASSIAVELEGPGLIRRNASRGGDAYTVFRAGEPHGRITPRLEQFVSLVSSADSAKATTNLWGERWAKLVINSMRNGMSAATGLGGNENDRREISRRLAIRIAAEGVRVGRALGYDIEPIIKLEPDKFVLAAEGNNAALGEVEEAIISQTKRRSEGQRPSMGQDMRKGRKTEIAFLNGLVAAKGREVGIPTPCNDGMVDLVTRVERGDLEPDPDNIKGL